MTSKEAIEILSSFGIINRYCSEDAEALDMAIKVLEQQSCEDCISREAALEIIEKEEFQGDAIYGIERLPSVTPKAKMGWWIDIQYFKNDDTYYRPKCPFCGIEPKEYSNYCPNCGADTREGEEEKNDE